MSVYKGDKIVGGGRADLEYIRKLHDPDWSQAVAISSLELFYGYTAPKRGIFVGATMPATSPGTIYIHLSNKIIAYGFVGGSGDTSENNIQVAVVNTPVSKGDTLKSSVPTLIDGNYKIYFVPYKMQ